MAFVNMYSELSGCVPKIPIEYCKTLVNRAYADARRQNLWSFKLFEANWTSPAIVNAGTVTTTQGANTVVFDATAATAINAIGLVPSAVTQRQFRVGIGTIYNIWAWDGVNTATLDRSYAEASGSGVAYAIGQDYYPAPMKDFETWVQVRDMVNFNNLITSKQRAWVDARDPQRTLFYIPTHVVYYQQDQNPNSATYRWPVFELWGNLQYQLTYQLYGIRKGVDLTDDTEELPPALTEDCVIALARKYAYEWAEANKGDMPRSQGSDWRFLAGAAEADYRRLFRELRKEDRELVDNWFGVRNCDNWLWGANGPDGYYNAIAGVANAGSPW